VTGKVQYRGRIGEKERAPRGRLISGRLKLSEIKDGFAALKSGAPVRQVIDFAAS